MRRLLIAALVSVLPFAYAAAATTAETTASLYRSSAQYVLPLSSGSIDPARDLDATDPSGGHDLVLVQFEAAGVTGSVDRLATTGARLVQPLAPVSYLVWADAAQTRAIRAQDGVRFAGVLPSSARIADDVTSAASLLRVTLVGDAPLAGALDSRPRAFTRVDGRIVTLPGDRDLAERLATNPRVYSIAAADSRPALRDEKGAQVLATPAGEPLAPGYRDVLGEFGADGSGVVFSHVDGGVDFNHPELADRVEACLDYSVVGLLCSANNHDDVIGHGTHTLGVTVGNGSTGLGDVAGFDYGLGVAPGATAVVQNAINAGSNAFEDGYRPVYEEAWELGAIFSQNSWGPSGSPEGYDEDTREMDSIVRDVDDDEPGDQQMGFVLSIMNGGGDESTQGSPDEGKNLVRVGGTGLRGLGAPGVDDLCTCTAHGPALDGRMLPDVVAPGQQVVSTRATQGTLCGLVGVGYSPTTPVVDAPSPLHAGCTGTSFASPHVSGIYAVFVDWYRQHHDGATPSPALAKAAIVNGAVDLAGGLDADGNELGHRPDNKQGWGRANLGTTLGGWETGAVHVDQTVVFDESGDSHRLSVEPVDPTQPMRATLVWTDALGHGEGGELPAWVNDLDLTVTGSDGTWLGNVFLDGWSVGGGSHDPMNNVENVFLEEPGPGSFTVTVDAANIIGDGLPSSGDATDQDFALVITNARTTTN